LVNLFGPRSQSRTERLHLITGAIDTTDRSASTAMSQYVGLPSRQEPRPPSFFPYADMFLNARTTTHVFNLLLILGQNLPWQQFCLNRLCCFPGKIVAVDLSYLTLAFAAMFGHCPSNLSLVLTATVKYIFILSLS
jgi:hypothetical protein